MDNLIASLTKLIVTVRRNMLSSVMTTLMLLVVIIAHSARGNIATFLENNPSVEQRRERVERSYMSSKKIDEALSRDLQSIKADRIVIRQYNDQVDYQTDNIVSYSTVTHVVVATGIAPPPPAMVSLPRSYIEDINVQVWTSVPKCVHLKTRDITHPVYRKFLFDLGGEAEQYVCPIVGLDDTQVGLLVATFLTEEKNRPSDEEIFAEMMNTSIRVSGYLAEVTSPEKQSWFRKLLSN